ncbi:MAG: chemotaxis protein CheB [Proteobacteria bacterium]|nr:chemotaxis protein CheB [Pseudomonadota bacterium]
MLNVVVSAAASPSASEPSQAGASSAPLAGDAPLFPVVGIGCSAGGLEALEAFLSHVPSASGLAFVVVQHLDPSHSSALPDLLQRVTTMPVAEAGDRMLLAPNRVYVIPPNKDLSVLHGVLHLIDPVERRGLRLPVDFFLRSLAADRQERAIGVILSGMGSDGMLGLAAIKEQSGLTLVQEPKSAQADSMPRSAIKAGAVDIVALPENMPAQIVQHFRHAWPLEIPADTEPESNLQSSLDKAIILLRQRSGNDFSLYKSSTLYRRIERRTALLQIAGIADYVGYLRENPQELDLLFKELLIGVTNFFRDPALWEFLAASALPELLAQYPAGKTLRAWVPACSSGEEAYSLAIVFKEALQKVTPERHFSLQIYATDLDVDAVDKARKGFYPANIAADVAVERLARYFCKEEDGYRVNKEIREMVVFAPHNITSDPPFTKLDILSCRNLLIYFGAALQKRLLPQFHYALGRNGILVLGSAESVGDFTDCFQPLDSKVRVFRRIEQVSSPSWSGIATSSRGTAPFAGDGGRADYRESVDYLTDQLIQQNYAPAAVLVNADGDILYISGRTGKYLEPAAGKVNINIHAMARDGLREALSGVIRNALRQSEPICLNGLEIDNDGQTQVVNVTVHGIDKPEALRNRVLVVFADVKATPAGRKRRPGLTSERENSLLQELNQTREALRTTQEEMQSSLEEVKSANEELQATNEELTTSKEELQSMNEELQTVNAEQQTRVDEMTWAQNDMTNLLNSTEIATIFLDDKMKLRRFTTHATHLFKLIPGDVGRSLSDIVSVLNYPQLQDDALAVLDTLIFREKIIATEDNRWFRVRIMPYRTQDNMINGVVITFIDITEIKRLETELRKLGAPATPGG